jgi:hypothetical protein
MQVDMLMIGQGSAEKWEEWKPGMQELLDIHSPLSV